MAWELRRGGGMRNQLHQDVIEHAVQVIAAARPLVESVARRDRDLAAQLRRALSSVALNLAEGLATEAGNARLRFETARGSLCEARAGLRVAVAWGYVSAEDAQSVLAFMGELGGRVFGLSRR
ncbi:MAG TPA: four helix bundle protein [Polyangiaceae bacterium]